MPLNKDTMKITTSFNQSNSSIKIEIEIAIESSMLNAEEDIQKALNKAGKEATAYALAQHDTNGQPVKKGKEKYFSKGKIPKKYQTPYGEIELPRYVYQSSTGGKTFCPLENSARIIVGSTPKFSKQVSSKYSESGGRRVQIDLKENHGRHISLSYIQDISNAVASGIIPKQEKWNYTIPVEEKNVETIGISLDGTCMLLTQDGYREAMVGAISFYDKKGERLYTQYTSNAPEYGKKTFFKNFEKEIIAIKKRYPNARFVGIADGAKENWTFLERYTSEQILDYYHASVYISLAGECIFRFKDDKGEWVGEMCHILKHEKGGAKEVLGILQDNTKKRMSGKKKDDLERCITYFKNHKHQMDYYDYSKNNYPIGSGVIEAACKVIIKQRLCNSGMKWKYEGAQNVLVLRCLNHSDTKWSQTWDKINKYGL